MSICGEYSFIWNITGFPAGILPVTTVNQNEQSFDDEYKDKYTGLFNSSCEGSAGMPISVQVIGFPFEDEKCLGVMKAIESKIDHKVKVPDIKLQEN